MAANPQPALPVPREWRDYIGHVMQLGVSAPAGVTGKKLKLHR